MVGGAQRLLDQLSSRFSRVRFPYLKVYYYYFIFIFLFFIFYFLFFIFFLFFFFSPSFFLLFFQGTKIVSSQKNINVPDLVRDVKVVLSKSKLFSTEVPMSYSILRDFVLHLNSEQLRMVFFFFFFFFFLKENNILFFFF